MAARDAFLVLEPDKIVATIDRLCQRVVERFPGSGLSQVAAALLEVARSAPARSKAIRSPRYVLRAISLLLLAAMAALLGYALLQARAPSGTFEALELVQGIEATLSGVVLLGAIVLFVVTIESRIRRRRALEALHELRALAHVIDLHQLRKDPERSAPADAPQELELSAFEVGRYLNYCGDLLAMVGKVAAFYVQSLQDEVVLAAVNEIEDLTNGLSRKIWQKLMLLEQMQRTPAVAAATPSSPPPQAAPSR